MNMEINLHSPRGRRKETTSDEFHRRYEIVEPGGCWVWDNPNGLGYGDISVGGGTKGAHRISWELHRGPIPKGLCICHRCDNKSCVNPEHLFLGTRTDNMQDMLRKRNLLSPPNRKLSARALREKSLTDDDIDEIRRLHQTKGTHEINLKYGVGFQVINRINRGTFRA